MKLRNLNFVLLIILLVFQNCKTEKNNKQKLIKTLYKIGSEFCSNNSFDVQINNDTLEIKMIIDSTGYYDENSNDLMLKFIMYESYEEISVFRNTTSKILYKFQFDTSLLGLGYPGGMAYNYLSYSEFDSLRKQLASVPFFYPCFKYAYCHLDNYDMLKLNDMLDFIPSIDSTFGNYSNFWHFLGTYYDNYEQSSISIKTQNDFKIFIKAVSWEKNEIKPDVIKYLHDCKCVSK